MLHKEIWGLTILAFILWIFLGAAPQRIERTCAPIGWMGNVTVSLAALVTPNYQKPVQRWFDKFTYGCQYTVWRLFYQDDYLKFVESQQTEEAKLKAAEAGGITPSPAADKKALPPPIPDDTKKSEKEAPKKVEDPSPQGK